MLEARDLGLVDGGTNDQTAGSEPRVRQRRRRRADGGSLSLRGCSFRVLAPARLTRRGVAASIFCGARDGKACRRVETGGGAVRIDEAAGARRAAPPAAFGDCVSGLETLVRLRELDLTDGRTMGAVPMDVPSMSRVGPRWRASGWD